MKRDFRIDILRTIGIILIILAHSSPPNILFQIRVFDVPLMAMLLGMSFVLSMKGKNFKENYGKYVFKRFKRLVLPTWIFLTIAFLLAFILTLITGQLYPFSISKIFLSYTLISGIGYVWIIRVFFVIALVSPILFVLSKKVNKLLHKILIIYFLLFIQQLLCIISESLNGIISGMYEHLIAISFGYIICAMVGFWVVNFKIKNLVIFTLSMLIPFIIMNVFIPFLSLKDQKYPPTPFFILYGLSISLILLLLLSNSSILNFFINIKIFQWASSYSLEIYFWHIIPIMFFGWAMPDANWVLKFLISLTASCVTTYFQTKFFPSLLSIK